MLEQVFNVAQVARNQVVHRNYIIPFFNKAIAQMRTQKTGTTGYQYSLLSHKLFRVRC